MIWDVSCPNCGSRLFVSRIGDYSGGHARRYYRCFRCFDKFTTERGSHEEGPEEPIEPPGGAGTAVRIVDTEIDRRPAGAKDAIETFSVELENRATEPIVVTGVVLEFDDGEEWFAPKDAIEVPSGERRRIEIHRSWIYPDQSSVRITVVSNDATIASTRVSLSG